MIGVFGAVFCYDVWRSGTWSGRVRVWDGMVWKGWDGGMCYDA
jgi:hypothetical protein